MIRHRCPFCSHWIDSSDHLIGVPVACRECGERVPVPAHSVANAPHASHPSLVGPGEAYAPPEPQPEEGPVEAGWHRVQDTSKRWVPQSPGSYLVFFFVVLAVVLAITVPLAWMLSGTEISTIVLWVVGVPLVGALLLLGLVDRLAPSFSHNLRLPGVLIATYIALCLGWATWLVMHVFFSPATVYIDNYSDRFVILELDGVEWVPIKTTTSQKKFLRPGTYELTVRDQTSGKPLEQMTVTVQGHGTTYVLNVLGAQVYARGEAYYGLSAMPEPPEQRIQDKWFRVEVDYAFTPPPQNVSVSRPRGAPAGGSATKTYLRRGEPKKTAK